MYLYDAFESCRQCPANISRCRLANSRLNNNAGFRFQGGPDGTGYHVKKRREELNKRSMPVGVPAHAAPLAPPPVDPEDLAALAEDEARLQWYSVADEYWKEYLNDLTRKTAIEKMVSLELKSSHARSLSLMQLCIKPFQTVFPAPAQRPEHLGVGPDRPPLAGYYARKTAENPTGSNSSGRTDDAKVSSLLEAQLKAGGSGKFGPILRGNFKRK